MLSRVGKSKKWIIIMLNVWRQWRGWSVSVIRLTEAAFWKTELSGSVHVCRSLTVVLTWLPILSGHLSFSTVTCIGKCSLLGLAGIFLSERRFVEESGHEMGRGEIWGRNFSSKTKQRQVLWMVNKTVKTSGLDPVSHTLITLFYRFFNANHSSTLSW